MVWTREQLINLWGNGKSFVYKGRKYTVTRNTGYPDLFFFTPLGKEGKETESMHPDTLIIGKLGKKKLYEVI